MFLMDEKLNRTMPAPTALRSWNLSGNTRKRSGGSLTVLLGWSSNLPSATSF